jgi:hypothetical protein
MNAERATSSSREGCRIEIVEFRPLFMTLGSATQPSSLLPSAAAVTVTTPV